MRRYPKAVLIVLILISFIGCDQVTKSYAVRELPLMTSANYLGGLVRFQLAENQGYFLGVGSTLPITLHTFIAITTAVVALFGLILLLVVSNKTRLSQLIAFSLLLAGCCGNLIDRLFNHGLVVDFIILGTNKIHTSVFNIADLLIMVSMVILIVGELVHNRAA